MLGTSNPDNKCPLVFDRPWSVRRLDDQDVLQRQVPCDELVLEKVCSGEIGPSVVISNMPRCLVATVRESRMPDFEVARQTLAAQGWPVVVRCTGGSCVPQGPGVLNLAILHPKVKGWHLEDGYRLLCDLLRELLTAYGLDATTGEVAGSFCDGRYNLQVVGKKLAGTAQRWAGGSKDCAAVLAHACLMVDLDLAEATEKINRLYNLCGNPQQFSAQACISLRDCLGPRTSQSTEAFMADASQRLLLITQKYFNTTS